MRNVFSLKRTDVLSTAQVKQRIVESLPNIYRYAYSLAGNKHDADDLLQSLVERMLKTSIPSNANSLAWMLKVCRNMWIDEFRKRQTKANYETELIQASEPAIKLEDDILLQIDNQNLQAALLKLPSQQREALCLVVMSGLSYAETAKVMEVPIGTVMSRLSKARRSLAQILKGKAGGKQ